MILEIQEDEETNYDSSNQASNSDNENDYATHFSERDVLNELIANHQFRGGLYY